MSMMTQLHIMTNRPPPTRADARLALAALALLATAAGPPPKPSPVPVPVPVRAQARNPPRGVLAVVERSLTQDQGAWLVGYRLRYQGAAGMVVAPNEIVAKVEGWVSNSRVSAHAAPRLSSVVVSGSSSGVADVVSAAEEAQRCRERVVVQVWTEDPSGDVEDAPAPPPPPSAAGRVSPADRQPTLNLAPGASVRVRLRLEHLHFLYGDYDPLLGARSVELTLGTATLRDVVPLDKEQYLAQAKAAWPAPPDDRRDDRHFLSAPDSLRIEAHSPGNQYYRYPERLVRYSTRMRLRYSYFIAAGTEGECRAKVTQYKETPTSWKVLSEGDVEQCLTTVGRWVRVEKVFRTEPEATTLALDFRICGAEIGQMWLDDVSLEPVGPQAQAGP